MNILSFNTSLAALLFVKEETHLLHETFFSVDNVTLTTSPTYGRTQAGGK